MASRHTRLLNMFIGLCNSSPTWPTLLYDMDYDVILIEEKIVVGRHAAATPDLVAYSGKHSHAIVVECKSGRSIQSHQDGSYSMLSTSDLKRGVVATDLKLSGHVVCYVVNHDNYPKLARQTRLPFIVFGDAVEGHGNFGEKSLDKALHAGAPLKGMLEPIAYYPFSHGEDIRIIVPYVISAMIALVRNPATRLTFNINLPDAAHSVLTMVHPYHSVLGRKEKTALTRKIRKIIKQLMRENPELAEQAKKVQGQRSTPQAIHMFVSACQKVGKDYADQGRIDGERWQ